MSAAEPEGALAASPLAGRPGLRWAPGLPTIASPMRQAVDAANWIVEADGMAPVFLKLYFPDTLEWLDLETAWAATVSAAMLGVGPDACFVLPDHHALAIAYLQAPWRTAFLNDLLDVAVIEGAVAAKRRLHAAPPFSRRWDIFAEIEALVGRARAAAAMLPPDSDALIAWSREASVSLEAAGLDLKPCHNDGSASSLMLGPDSAVMLVDFDRAGQADPFYDIALLLNEASALGQPWELGLELYAGRADQGLVDRCRVYALADDIFWGFWGWAMSATSPRRNVEFLKYGEWRLLRARMALLEDGFADRLRGL